MDGMLARTLAAIRRRDWDAAAAAALAATAAGGVLPRPAVPMMTQLVGALRKSGRADAAAVLADRVIAGAPDEPAAWLARSHLAQHRGDLAAAIADTRAAMARSADPRPARPRLADLLYEAGELEAAAAELHAALGPEGRDPVLLARLADVADAAGDTAGMAAALDRAMAIRRAGGVGSPALLMALLRAGRLADAVPDLDLRWAASGAPPRPFRQPVWDGGPATDRTLLVWGEQGLGEEIWTAALLPDVLPRVGRLVVECAPRLAALFRRSFPAATVVPRGAPPHPAADAAELPPAWVGLLGARAVRPGPHPPHLRSDPAAAAALRARYRALGDGPLIGLSWRSANRHAPTAKSSRLADWGAILGRPAVFLDLQYGDTDADRAEAAAGGWVVHRDPAVDPLGDLDHVAAQMAALDAIVTVSNTTAHLAGALGVPSAVLLPRGRGQVWCWLDGRTPWYAGQRICRQERAGRWEAAIAGAAAMLDGLFPGP
ncbi:hypothetical protein [Stella sp.]|uniref:hypothetical protein n=1 Tax=Stella sp. TaxID=2912054 RepID=UPI0035AF6994